MPPFAQLVNMLAGMRLTEAQLSAFDAYERELLLWNQKMNLTAIRDAETIRVKHFLDSLTCLKVMRDTSMERVVDIGTGAGFPGLPLKIVCPSMRLTLVESIKKKAEFCRHVVNKLCLPGVAILAQRAEVIGQQEEHREKYDWAVARAVAHLRVLAEYLLPLVRNGGTMLAMKGESAIAEAQEAEQALRVLGGHIRCLVPVNLPGVVEDRYLVLVDKVAATPKEYPRRVGIPTKRPL